MGDISRIKHMTLNELKREYIECKDSNPVRAIIISKIIKTHMLNMKKPKSKIIYKYPQQQSHSLQLSNIPNIPHTEVQESVNDIMQDLVRESIQSSNSSTNIQQEPQRNNDTNNDMNDEMFKFKDRTQSEFMNKKMMDRMNSDINMKKNLVHQKQSIDKPFY